MQLRDYQTNANAIIRQTLSQQPRRIAVQSPTGSGKGVMIADLLLDDTPQLLLTHRRVLLDQLSRVLTSFGIKHGVRAAGERPDPTAPIQLAMTQTEYARVFRKQSWAMHLCTRVHIDEIHAQGGESTQTILNAYHRAQASIIGWTATPSEISHMCDELIVVATVPELIAAGHLVPPVVFGPDMPDAERLETVKRQANGEYSPTDLAKVWNEKAIFGRVVKHYHLLNPDRKPAILFAPGVPQSIWFAQRFSALGIRAAHIDGDNVWLDRKQYKSDSAARQAVFDGSQSGDIQLISNRFVLREGFDAPWIEHVINATAYGSRSAWAQANGRGLRPFPGKERCIIADHGGNWLRHPALDSDEPWDMATPARILAQERIEKLRNNTEPEPIYCPECTCIRVSGDTCPECGFRYLRRSRPVLQASGELKLVHGPAYRQRPITPRDTDQQDWDRLYWGAKKYRPERTFQQLYTYYAVQHGWRWLPRTLKLMPLRERGWFMPVGTIGTEELR